MILLIKIGLRHVAEPMFSNPQNLEFAKKTAMFFKSSRYGPFERKGSSLDKISFPTPGWLGLDLTSQNKTGVLFSRKDDQPE